MCMTNLLFIQTQAYLHSIEKSCLQKYLVWFSKYCGKLKKQADESTVAAKMTTKNKSTAMQCKFIVLVVFLQNKLAQHDHWNFLSF